MGMWTSGMSEPDRWTTRKEKRAQARQQTGTDPTAGVEPPGTKVGSSVSSIPVHLLTTPVMCRTHRERKENYIKALELELARLRETFLLEQNARDATIQQQKLLLENQQRENLALREILTTRGVSFETELENRKAVMAMRTKREDNSLSPAAMATLSPSSMAGRQGGYQQVVSGPASAATGYSPQYLNGGAMSISGHSPGTTHHSHSPHGPEVQEFSIKYESGAISDMPGMPTVGVFEQDPQLGIDFILR